MFDSILRKLGFGGRKKEAVTTVRLDIIAEQVKEFNEAKKQINEKIDTLETKTNELDHVITETLDMTRENKDRLDNIETSLRRIVDMSEAVITAKSSQNKSAASTRESDGGQAPAK